MLKMVLLNLRGRRLRNTLTILSVAMAIGLFAFFLAIVQTIRDVHSVTDNWHRIVTLSRQDSTLMTRAAKRDIEKIQGVTLVIDILVIGARSSDQRYRYPVIGTDDGWATAAGFTWCGWTDEEIETWKKQRDAMMVGERTAQALNLHVGDQARLITAKGELSGKVVAVGKGGLENTVVDVHYDYLNEFLGRPSTVFMRTVDVERDEQIPQVAAAVDELFKNSGTPTRSMAFNSYFEASARRSNAIPQLLTSIGLVVLLTTLLVTTNTVSVSVRERSQELATLRAIGFRRNTIFGITVIETTLISLIGGAIGVAVPALAFPDGIDLGDRFFSHIRVGLWPAVGGVVAALALGIFASAIPAWRASRAEVSAGLRQAA